MSPRQRLPESLHLLPLSLLSDEEEELNEDTVEKIVRCIIQNEANVEALKEMLVDGEGDVLCPHRTSQDGGLPHHHTVHLGSTQAPCIHCSKRKRPPLHRQGRSKEGKGRMHPGETTVFSVGRKRGSKNFRLSRDDKLTLANYNLCLSSFLTSTKPPSLPTPEAPLLTGMHNKGLFAPLIFIIC
uniref:RELT like 2 n=1 Tax=Pelusios castaneus TaxID=367368 RepID=A0A8C8SHJ1_9SAUR